MAGRRLGTGENQGARGARGMGSSGAAMVRSVERHVKDKNTRRTISMYQRSWNCIIVTSTLTSMSKRNLNATPDTHNMKTKRAVQINMCCIGCSEYTPARACTLSKESICRVPFFQGKKKHSPCDFRFLPDGSGPRRVVTQTTDPMHRNTRRASLQAPNRKC